MTSIPQPQVALTRASYLAFVYIAARKHPHLHMLLLH